MSMRAQLAVECRFETADPVPSIRLLKRWASAALGARGRGRELSLTTVGAARMRTLNRRYRGKDKPTNVLSFPAQVHPAARGAEPLPLGDVVICPRVLRREALEQGKAERAHWAHLVVHGALHLAGYDHELDADARRMERREIAVLRALGFGNPYLLPAPGAAR